MAGSGYPVFIAPRDGESCMRSGQLHGLHAVQQRQPGAVSHNYRHRLQSVAVRACPAALWLRRQTEGDGEAPADQHPCQCTTFIRSQRTLSPRYYEHNGQILHDLNGHGVGSQTTFQFSYHTTRNRVMMTFRPGLKACTGLVTMMPVLSLPLGWPDQVKLLLGRGNTATRLPNQAGSGREPLHTLWPRCWHSRGRQHQELPVARHAHAMDRSYAMNFGGWIGCPCAGQSSSMSRWLESMVTARRSRLKAGHAPSSYCSGGEAATFKSENKNLTSSSLPPPSSSLSSSTSTQYHWRSVQCGLALSSIFKGLFCLPIPLLKGPVMRAGMRLAGDVLRGKTMKRPHHGDIFAW